MTFNVLSYGGCGDPQTCVTGLGVQTLPFASRNTQAVVYMGANIESTTGALTAPAWAFAKMYNATTTTAGGIGIDLRTMNFGSTYTIPASAKSNIIIPNSRVDNGYTMITVKNGAITYLH